jgi:porin
VAGGQRASAAQAGQFDLGVTIDAQKLFGWTGGTLQTAMTYREGALLPVNLLQQPQEIYGRGDIARLVELSYEQKLFDDHLTVKFGRLPEGEFNDFGCDFANLTFCGPPAGNIVGNYWFNAPIAQWAAWGRVDVGNVDFRTGVYETNPQDLNLSFSPGWFCCATGVTVHAEVGWSPKFGPNALQGHYQAGFWDDTAGGPDVLLDATGRPFVLTGLPPLHRDEQYGFYIQGIQQITGTGTYNPEGDYRPRKQSGWMTTEGLAVFFNSIQTDGATATLDNQIAAGLLYAAPFASRPNDMIGVAIGRTGYNSRAAAAIELANPGVAVPRAEYPLELFYSYNVRPGWSATGLPIRCPSRRVRPGFERGHPRPQDGPRILTNGSIAVTSPILKLFLSRIEELTDRISSDAFFANLGSRAILLAGPGSRARVALMRAYAVDALRRHHLRRYPCTTLDAAAGSSKPT